MKVKNKFLKGIARPTLQREVRKLEKNAQTKAKRKVVQAIERKVEQVAEPAVKEKSAISKLAGSLVGSVFGSNAGEAASDIAGGIGKIFGFGDYEVQENTVVDNLERLKVGAAEVPAMHSESDSVIIRHREMIGKVYSSVNFKSRIYPIQPGESISFPWGAAIFQNYTKYKMRGLVYEYQSTTANGMSSDVPALGDVMMATQYDNTDSVFVNAQQLMNHHFATAAEPSQNFMHAVECKPQLVQLNQFNIRTSPVTNIQTINMYDMGYLTIATQGQRVDGVAIGNLWATYEIELFIPRMSAELNLGGRYAHYHTDTVSSVQGYFGTSGKAVATYDSIGVSIGINAASGRTESILFPRGIMGSYEIAIVWRGAVNADQTGVPVPSQVGWKPLEHDPLYSNGGLSWGEKTNTNTILIGARIDDPEVAAKFVIGGSDIASNYMVGTYSVDIVITQINGNVGGTTAPAVSSYSLNARQGLVVDSLPAKAIVQRKPFAPVPVDPDDDEPQGVELSEFKVDKANASWFRSGATSMTLPNRK